MVLNFNNKKEIIKKNHNIAKSALSAITADISKITVNEMNDLRRQARELNIEMSVIRNTLLKKSLKNTNFSQLINILKGPTLIAFSMKHPGSASRLFKKFTENNTKFKIITAIFEKKILSLQEIEQLAILPTYEEILTKFIIILKEVSIGKLLRTLNAICKNKKDQT
ncbi:50S ribosomal protein L10 [Buchnera aphidicola (Cinara tujafilina)]|uniref:Large ribosomal subunit protein uL10 n=1 Tax=Buchnera aphidicola (Cinara tujafilina) TaxID=261317 RepID=F7WYX0_9GAMM|nr:50S ribosomal protein L10 [Buchnera aphidicola]AEH39620.1 50S ribosomal protein L10 [Buchnera aphidicola (Cinara tujafilina)]